MEIVKFPNRSLFESCVEVRVFGDNLKVLLDAMWDTMRQNNGIGLAANQVRLPYRMFVMEGPDEGRIYLVNPIVKAKSQYFSTFKEGCLSAPGESLHIADRASWIMVEYQDAFGNKNVDTFTDIWSVCVQHEMDHLDGKSFMDSKTIPKNKRKELAKRWNLKSK